MSRTVKAEAKVPEAKPKRPEIERNAAGQTVYKPDGYHLAKYIIDNSRVAIIRGPVGSGKSVGSMIRLWRHCCEQEPHPITKMRTLRIAIVRNTYPDLEQSTVKTWLNLFPEEVYGRFYYSKPMVHPIRIMGLDVEVVFLALDKKEDVRKLRSTEWTIIYFNELQYIPKELFDEATTRVGRFPAVKDGGPTYYGVIADMNAPEEDHWLPPMVGEVEWPENYSEEDRARNAFPDDWFYTCQPPGLLEEFGSDGKTVIGYRDNPDAENVKWLVQPYVEMAKGKTKAFIDSRLMNRITMMADGDPVWPQFVVETHAAKVVIPPLAGHPVYVGLDFGRRPSAVFGQLVNNRWRIVHEMQMFDASASLFAPAVKRAMFEKFAAGTQFHVYGDPKGRDKTQAFEQTAYDIFAANGINVQPAPVKGNDIRTRIEAVTYVLTGMIDGQPRFILSAACRSLKVAMAGKYHLKKVDGVMLPVKDKYSDLADALQYMVLGAGEGREMVGRSASTQIKPISSGRTRGAGRRVH